MWQVLLAAAAAAGSGILAKKFINPTETEKPVCDFKLNDQECEENKSLQHQDSVFPIGDVGDVFQENSGEDKREAASDAGKVFRFSSPQTESELEKKKSGSKLRRLKRNGGGKRGKKSGLVEGGEEDLVVDQRGNGSAKRVSVCLKKRRTGKHAAGKCESCASKDNSFGWGVGVGIMYMMSAGKAEISRLNCAVDETANIVQELKAEISRRKSSCDEHTFFAGAGTNKKHIEGCYGGPLFTKPHAKSKYKMKNFGPSLIKEGECASSLTEEELPEVLEMDQLGAELESELQKLPWCGTESSGSEGRPDVFKAEILKKEQQPADRQNSDLWQYDGVSPTELDKKLSCLLIEQQESQIAELEAELHQTHSKLQEKEAALQALKNCVKGLSEFSLASVSDEEIENNEDVKTRDGTKEKLEFEPTKSTVGMKRMMSYESHVCSSE